MESERTHAHEFVGTHVSGTHKIDVVLKASLYAEHISVKSVACAESGPYLHLLRVFRSACAEAKCIVFPVGIAKQRIASFVSEHTVGDIRRSAPYIGERLRRI